MFVTAPVGAHMVGRAAYRSGTILGARMTTDELAEHRPPRRPVEGADPRWKRAP
jgi:multisubunit Na+/H+ antiporter MnhG subunit